MYVCGLTAFKDDYNAQVVPRAFATQNVSLSENSPVQTVLRRVSGTEVEIQTKKSSVYQESNNIFPDQPLYEEADVDRPRVINVPNFFTVQKYNDISINTLQEWEGLIDSIENDMIIAQLSDISQDGGTNNWAEIPITNVETQDRNKVVVGALFRLIVGYVWKNSSRQKQTIIYFRRHLPKAHDKFKNISFLLEELK